MKSLKESIFGDIEDIVSNDTVLIEQFLNDNYDIHGTYNIDGNVVNVDGQIYVKNMNIESLTNGIFQFGKVDGSFYCHKCKNLKSLEGAPRKVGKAFYCHSCHKLKSLEGAPEKVGGNFWCSGCRNLKITDQDRNKYKLED